ncbi:hypothetical protein AB1E18_004092 [Capra hircus]
MGSIKDRNGRDLTKAEDIKKRWQEYTEELYKKDLHDPHNHKGVITHIHLEPDILECEVRWALGSITTNKASGGDGIPEYIMRNSGLEETQAGIKIAGRNVNNLRYADDTTIMAESEEELKSLVMKMKEESEKAGLKLNIQKTKIVASGPITSWQIDGKTGEAVADFIFGGSNITADGDCSHEIKRCLLPGRKVMTNLDSILKSRDITLPTKRQSRAALRQPPPPSLSVSGCGGRAGGGLSPPRGIAGARSRAGLASFWILQLGARQARDDGQRQPGRGAWSAGAQPQRASAGRLEGPGAAPLPSVVPAVRPSRSLLRLAFRSAARASLL